MSCTNTCCWQVAVLPLLSVAVQVTRFVPTGNCAGALLVTVTVPQLSLTVGLPRMTLLAKQLPTSVFTVTSTGQVIVGTSVSFTVTVKVHSLVFPLLSIAVFVTIVTPFGKVLPLAGLLTKFVTVQLSVAVTIKVTLVRLHAPGSVVNT